MSTLLAPASRVFDDAAELRAAAHRHLVIQWGGKLSEDLFDDWAQTAWEQLWEREKKGEPIAHPEALVKTIAWRLANKEWVKDHVQLVDPSKLTRAAATRSDSDPAKQIELRSDVVNIAILVDQLTDRQQAVLRGHFVDKLSVRDMAARLGASKSTIARELETVREHFDGVLETGAEHAAMLKVLTAYAFGDKSVRKLAELLLKNEPGAHPLLRQITGVHEGAAALVPPALLEGTTDVNFVERIGHGLSDLRERVTAGGADQTGLTDAATQLASSGAGRGPGAAAGGALATITGALGAKGVALCAGGAATAACVVAVVSPSLGPLENDEERPAQPAEAAAESQRPDEPLRLPAPNPILVKPASSTEPAPDPGRPAGDGGGSGDGGGARAPSSPAPATASSPSDPSGYNPYNPASTTRAPAAPASPAPSSSSSSSGGSSSGGCNPYDVSC